MNPQMMFHNAASNIICQVLFAKRFDYQDEFMKFFVNLFHETSKIINGPWSVVSHICCLFSIPLNGITSLSKSCLLALKK